MMRRNARRRCMPRACAWKGAQRIYIRRVEKSISHSVRVGQIDSQWITPIYYTLHVLRMYMYVSRNCASLCQKFGSRIKKEWNIHCRAVHISINAFEASRLDNAKEIHRKGFFLFFARKSENRMFRACREKSFTWRVKTLTLRENISKHTRCWSLFARSFIRSTRKRHKGSKWTRNAGCKSGPRIFPDIWKTRSAVFYVCFDAKFFNIMLWMAVYRLM